MATLFDAFGSRVYREYGAYNATTGTWTCERGSGNATQSTAAKRPAASTTTSGQSCPNFDASSTAAQADYLEIPTLATLPAFNNASHNRMFACIYRRTGVMPHGASIFYRCVDVYGVSILDGKVEACGARANDVADSGVWHRMIVVKNGSGAVTMYIDGVAQTTTGTGQLGQDWRQYAGALGARENGDYPHGGELARMAFLYDVTTPFSGGDIAAADAVLATYLAAGGGPVSIAVSSAGVATTAAAMAVTRRLSASVAANATTAAAAKVSRRVSASSAGAALATVAAKRTVGFGGSAVGLGSTAAAIACRRPVAPSANGSAVVSPAALRVARTLTPSAPGTATTAGALRVERRLSATSAGQGTAVAVLRVDRRLVASSAGVGSTQLELTVEGVNEVLFAPIAAGVATATAALTVARRLGASTAGSASVAPIAIRVQRRVAPTSAAAASAIASASVVRGFVATSAGFATAIAALTVGDEAAAVPGGNRVTVIAFIERATVRVDRTSSKAVVFGVDGRSLPMFTIKKNDREPAFRAKLFQDDAPAPLTGATVKFLMKLEGAMPSAAPKVSAAATIVDPVNGIVRYDWATDDTNIPGNYRAEFEVTYANGKSRTFPNEDYLPVRVVGDLG